MSGHFKRFPPGARLPDLDQTIGLCRDPDPLAIRRSLWLYRSWNQLRLEGWGRRSTDSLQRLAQEYGVPMVRLAEAVQNGLLAEFGLPRQQIKGIEIALRAA